MGNHENNSPVNFNNFDLPGIERCYRIEENRIHYIVLDSNSDSRIGPKQYFWLENDLQNISNDVLFVIVLFVHLPFVPVRAKKMKKILGNVLFLFVE